MNRHRKFRIRIDDESHLSTLADVTLSPATAVAGAVVLFTAMVLIAGAIVTLTPLRTLLPGYLNESQRVASEENILRLDSLREKYARNQEFIDNYLRVTDIDRTVSDSVAFDTEVRELTPDSLLPALPAEKRFMTSMEERERFNISVLAPLAADGMLFSPVTSNGIFTADSRTSDTGVLLVPEGTSVQSAADGTVVGVYYSTSDKGYAILIQHHKGFLSGYYGVGIPLVSTADTVDSGQIIALAPGPDARNRRTFTIRLWHNGLPVVPYEYVGASTSVSIPETPYEAPRGR